MSRLSTTEERCGCDALVIRLTEGELERISRNRGATNPEKHDVVIAIKEGHYSRGNSHHNVYVVELDPVVGRARSIRSLNPNRDPGKPCVYVGMTGIDPYVRFEQHKKGYRAARLVKKHGVAIIKRFLRDNPMTYEEAQKFEVERARRLKNRGYAVWQN